VNHTPGCPRRAGFARLGASKSPTLQKCSYHSSSGKERDSESGLDYFIARHYASTLGRFLQPDEFTGGPVDAFSSSDPLPPGPLPYAEITNPNSLNKYSYTWNRVPHARRRQWQSCGCPTLSAAKGGYAGNPVPFYRGWWPPKPGPVPQVNL
jgi:RHS repeat-associated protein